MLLVGTNLDLILFKRKWVASVFFIIIFKPMTPYYPILNGVLTPRFVLAIRKIFNFCSLKEYALFLNGQ